MNNGVSNFTFHVSRVLRSASGRKVKFGRSALGVALTMLLLVTMNGFCASSTVGANPSTEFDAANRLYEQGKFKEAIAAYEALAKSGSVSPALFFNLGNSFYKAGEIGRAIGSYR